MNQLAELLEIGKNVFLGVGTMAIVSYFWSLIRSNKTKIPLHTIALRAAASIPITIVVWTLTTMIIVSWAYVKGWLPVPMTFWLSFSIGAAMPCLTILRYIPLNPADKPDWLIGVIRGPLAIGIFISENTGGYVEKIIRYQERKALRAYVTGHSPYCVTKAFEFHVIEIAESKKGGREGLKNILRMRNAYVKNWLLLRFLGHPRWYHLLNELKNNPDIIFPNWSSQYPERRQARADRRDRERTEESNEQRKLPWGRRRTDYPYTQQYILGADSPYK